MPSAVAKSPNKANRHVQEEAVCKIRIAPAECQHNHEQHRFYDTLSANLAMLFHATYYSTPKAPTPHYAGEIVLYYLTTKESEVL